jgi:chromosome segregation ATPase
MRRDLTVNACTDPGLPPRAKGDTMPCTLTDPHDCATVRQANDALRRHLDRACDERNTARKDADDERQTREGIEAELGRLKRELAEIERRARVEEPEGQTIRQLNVSVRRLRDENHEQRVRAQNAEDALARAREELAAARANLAQVRADLDAELAANHQLAAERDGLRARVAATEGSPS